MEPTGNGFSWHDLIDSGLAFFFAIIGWVWHAGRLASKVDNVENRLEDHLDASEKLFKENRETHEKLINKLDHLAELLYGKDRGNKSER